MIQKGTEGGGGRRQKLRKEFPENGWSESGMSCSVVCVYQRQIRSVDELKRRLIVVRCGVEVEQSIFDEAILTSGEEDFKRVSMLKEDTMSTACELTMLKLSIYICYIHVTCLSVPSLITKSCQQRSFYKVVH